MNDINKNVKVKAECLGKLTMLFVGLIIVDLPGIIYEYHRNFMVIQ